MQLTKTHLDEFSILNCDMMHSLVTKLAEAGNTGIIRAYTLKNGAIHSAMHLMSLARQDMAFTNVLLQVSKLVEDIQENLGISYEEGTVELELNQAYWDALSDQHENYYDLPLYKLAYDNSPFFKDYEAETFLQTPWFNRQVFAQVADTVLRICHIEYMIQLMQNESEEVLAELAPVGYQFITTNAVLPFIKAMDGAAKSSMLVEFSEKMPEAIEELMDVKSSGTFSIVAAQQLVLLFSRMQAAYITLTHSKVYTVDLLKTDNDRFKNISNNDNEVICEIQMPVYALEPTKLITGNEYMHFDSLVKLDELGGDTDKNSEIIRGINYSFDEDYCTCSHDCCGCVSTSVSASLVKNNYVLIGVSKSANY